MAALAPSPAKLTASQGDRLRSEIDRRLAALAPPEVRSDTLARAMRHALLAPGKRIRPLMVLLACRDLGAREHLARDHLALDHLALDAACALEMVHASSLVLDDLPSMDDAGSRRGQPATHVAFGEDVAILAAVSLLAAAFETLATAPGLADDARARAVLALSRAIGHAGLSGGQHADLRARSRPQAVEVLLGTNDRKTGALFVAAVEIAAAVAGAGDDRLASLRRFASHVGQAFQLMDDLQDDGGEDAGRPTLLSVVGDRDCRDRLALHVRGALAEVEPGGGLARLAAALFADAGRP